MATFPDYYAVLRVQKTVTADEIRQAYKRESLRTHPDKLVNPTDAQRKAATEEFQTVADAYFVLSDPVRRQQYDSLYAAKGSSNGTTDPNAPSWWTNMFGFGSTSNSAPNAGQRPNADHVFADVFDELLRPEVERRGHLWSYIGAACGGGLGFIVANIPGLMLGAVAGNRAGAIRDAKGKSVATVFSHLATEQKAEILRALAMKVSGL